MSARNNKSKRKRQRKLKRKIVVWIKLKADLRNAMEARAFFLFVGSLRNFPQKGNPFFFGHWHNIDIVRPLPIQLSLSKKKGLRLKISKFSKTVGFYVLARTLFHSKNWVLNSISSRIRLFQNSFAFVIHFLLIFHLLSNCPKHAEILNPSPFAFCSRFINFLKRQTLKKVQESAFVRQFCETLRS